MKLLCLLIILNITFCYCGQIGFSYQNNIQCDQEVTMLSETQIDPKFSCQAVLLVDNLNTSCGINIVNSTKTNECNVTCENIKLNGCYEAEYSFTYISDDLTYRTGQDANSIVKNSLQNAKCQNFNYNLQILSCQN